MSIFALLVLVGFILNTIAVWGGPSPWFARFAWLCWLIAAFLWAVGQMGAGFALR